jgi:integrase
LINVNDGANGYPPTDTPSKTGARRERGYIRMGGNSYQVLVQAGTEPLWPHGRAVSHRYVDMCAEIGITSHLHAPRHYTATELLTAGIDLRTVAGRLGHAGGGATTLRAAWVGESDRHAAEILGSRLHRPDR